MVGNKGNEYLDVNDDRCEINEKHTENGECSIKINVAVTNKITAISMIPIYFIDEIKISLYPRVKNSITQLTIKVIIKTDRK